MKIIHDNLWGDIEMSDLAIQIIDTRHFQRLHYIKQTGFSYKVFPNAMTTRFQHSIGVYHVTKTFLQILMQNQPHLMNDLNERKMELLCLSGLLHDIGHGPYSHQFDSLLHQWINKDWIWTCHENRSIDLIQDMIHYYQLEINEVEMEFIKDRILGKNNENWYDCLINNKNTGLDCDKIDYLLRDSLNFGFQIKFDPNRIFKNARVIDNEICYCEKIKDEIITCFLIRNKMNQTIYRHPKILEFENKYSILLDNHLELKEKIITICLEKNVSQFLNLNDYNLIEQINWKDIECRQDLIKLNHKENLNDFIDIEWHKIVYIKFYNRKNINQSFNLLDWKIISCFS